MTLHAEAIERKQKAPPLTVDGLLRRRASQRPGVTALCDPPNLAALGFGAPKTLSYRETDAAVDALASFFIEAGARARRHGRGPAPQSRHGAADIARRLARRPHRRRCADAVAGGGNRQGLRRGRAEGADRRIVLRRREARGDALRGGRFAAVGALRARLRPRPARRRRLARRGHCRRADRQRAPDGLSAAPLAGHDHLHRARRRAARGRRPPRGRASRPRRDDRAVALARCGRRDPQSLSLDRAGGAFARADGMAGRRGHAGPAHAVRLSAFRHSSCSTAARR